MTDASEESDNIGYLVEQSDNYESDEPGESGEFGESSSDSPPNDFLDLEAAESDQGSSGSGWGGADHDEPDAAFSFPQFTRLPIELRHRIWEFFCPDLTVKSRVYFFQVSLYCSSGNGTLRLRASEGPFLDQQTGAARAVLAVNHESRQLALKAFPDALSFGSHDVLRFNSNRDVVALVNRDLVTTRTDRIPPLSGFSKQVRQLAVEPTVLENENQMYLLLAAFESLQTVYYLASPTEHSSHHLRWCTSDLVRRYSLTMTEEELGLREDVEHVYCWPDLDNHRAFAEAEIPLEYLSRDRVYIKNVRSFNGPKLWPMVEFCYESGLRRFDKLLEWERSGSIDWDLSDEDEGEPDEYESEGIDDSDISEQEYGSDSDDLAVLVDDGSERDEEDSEGSLSVLSRPPHPENQGGTIDLIGHDYEAVPGFSSPEHPSATLRGSDEVEDGSYPAPRFSRLKRPRARVVASDSDDRDGEDEDTSPRKRARTEDRRNLIAPSRNDEAGESRKIRANRRARAVLPEDDAEDYPENDTGSVDEEDESCGSAAAPKPVSLAEKLQLHREKVSIPVSDDEEDSEIEEGPGDDNDARDYADFQDDEEGNEISEDGDEDQDGVFMNDEDDEEGGY